jgi:hypothetical protein
VIAVEFARQPDQPVHCLKIALHHHGARDDHRFAEPGDLQPDEAGGRINLAARQHFRDDASNALHAEPLDARDMRHRQPRRQPLQNPQPPLRRRAPRGASSGGGERAASRRRDFLEGVAMVVSGRRGDDGL